MHERVQSHCICQGCQGLGVLRGGHSQRAFLLGMLARGLLPMQDADSLAHYNVGPETMLSLAVRERGGRKK